MALYFVASIYSGSSQFPGRLAYHSRSRLLLHSFQAKLYLCLFIHDLHQVPARRPVAVLLLAMNQAMNTESPETERALLTQEYWR
jgi:hypothetical protein